MKQTQLVIQKASIFGVNLFVTDAFGKITTQCSANTAETIVTLLDLSETESIRQTWPYLRDRRVDAYQNLDKRFIDD